MKTITLKSRAEWRQWLAENYAKEPGVWLVFYKNHTGESGVPYEATVEEALCYGWIDSIIKRIDDDRYVRKYTPRKDGSVWSGINKARAEKMIRAGRMEKPGLARVSEAKSSGMWNQSQQRPQLPDRVIPPELKKALASHPKASGNFEKLAPYLRRQYILWIATAKKEETRERRVKEAVDKLERGESLGLK